MKHPAMLAAVCAVLLAAATPLDGGPALALRVSRRVALAPAFLTISAIVEPSDQNRALEVVIDSGEFYRSSRISLNGLHAPRLTVFDFPSVPSGRYDVRATLDGATGRRATDGERVDVLESAGIR